MGFLRFLSGLIVGAAVGAGAVMLMAPQSGDDLRRKVREQVDLVVEEGRRAAAERRAELEAQFAQAKSVSKGSS